MNDLWRAMGAESGWGPALCTAGLGSLLSAACIYGYLGKPSIFRPDSEAADIGPTFWERLSLHLLVYAGWAVGFGAIVWRGAPSAGIDVRLAGEANWPVIQSAEWVYLSSYFVPLGLPWLSVKRSVLRRYALDLGWVLAISLVLFLLLPVASPPRLFVPDSWAGKILAWETGRADFAAASLPSFHVCWALLCAQMLAKCGDVFRLVGWTWALAVAAACVANGAHAVADVAASMVLVTLLTAAWSPGRRLLAGIERGLERRWANRIEQLH